MRADKTDICNIAIGYCGSTDWIQSIDDTDSVSARRCNRFFDIAAEKVLREHDWASATAYVQLAQNTTTPIIQFAYKYALPFDCAKVVQCYSDDVGYSPYDRWEVHERDVYTDMTACYIKYVKFPEDYRDLDVLLADAIAYELAVMLAPTLVKDKEAYFMLTNLAKKALARAKAMDTMESKTLYTENDIYEDQRLRVGGRTYT